MTLQNLHEMIRNLSSYIKSLEVLCESGVRLAKNFERLLAVPAGGGGGGSGPSSSNTAGIDNEILLQSVSNWEIVRSRVEQDSNSLISELLPILQEAVQNVMKEEKDQQTRQIGGQLHSENSHNTFEVFRSSFAAFFQIQWRFCSLYLQCASQGSYPHGFARTPTDSHGLVRSPTASSFNSSSGTDRRESTESCFSSFSMHRSSISGLSSLSSRSSSPSHGLSHYYDRYHRSRNSSLVDSSGSVPYTPSVKFTPSQPPSPLFPYTEGAYTNLFRRWSTHTPNLASNQTSSLSPSNSSNLSAVASYGASSNLGSGSGGGSCGSGGSGGGGGGHNPIGSRRWSVPASTHPHPRKSEQIVYDAGLLDAINLLSVSIHNNINSSSNMNANSTIMESSNEFRPIIENESTITSLWPPSETRPGVVLTTCVSDPENTTLQTSMENLQFSSQQNLRVPFGSASPESTSSSSTSTTAIQSNQTISPPLMGEYSLFGNSPSPTAGN